MGLLFFPRRFFPAANRSFSGVNALWFVIPSVLDSLVCVDGNALIDGEYFFLGYLLDGGAVKLHLSCPFSRFCLTGRMSEDPRRHKGGVMNVAIEFSFAG